MARNTTIEKKDSPTVRERVRMYPLPLAIWGRFKIATNPDRTIARNLRRPFLMSYPRRLAWVDPHHRTRRLGASHQLIRFRFGFAPVQHVQL